MAYRPQQLREFSGGDALSGLSGFSDGVRLPGGEVLPLSVPAGLWAGDVLDGWSCLRPGAEFFCSWLGAASLLGEESSVLRLTAEGTDVLRSTS